MKDYLFKSDIEKIGNRVGHIYNGNLIKEEQGINDPGFYFVVESNVVIARFFSGKQKNKCAGFYRSWHNMKMNKTSTFKILKTKSNEFSLIVYQVPIDKLKSITTAKGKGVLGTILTRQHTSDMQTLTELTYMLSELYNFEAQKK